MDNEKLLKMVLEEGKATTEVAQNLGIPVSLLYKWIRQHKGIDSKGKTENLQEENKKLKIEIQDLKKQLTTSEMYRNPKKGGGVLRSPNAVKYAWIEEQQGLKEFNVDAMCEALDVNRSGYYAHKNSPLTSHQNEDERLSVLISNRSTTAVRPTEHNEFRRICANKARELVVAELHD